MSLEPILEGAECWSVGADRMSVGRLFHTAGPATENARLPRRSLVRGTTRSPRAAERRATRVETDETGTHLALLRNHSSSNATERVENRGKINV